MEVSVNGHTYDISPDLTVDRLLHDLSLEQGHLAVAINGEILRRADRVTRVLREGDEVELVQAVGGG